MKEFRVLEVKKEKNWENLERLLAEQSAAGWEVVNLSVDISADLRGRVIVLLQREK